MDALLEVIALTPADVAAAAAGGADRCEVVGTMDDDGLSPAPELVASMVAESELPLRVMLRLRNGFSTDGGEFVRLRGLAAAYADAGAEGMVLGFLNGYEEVDVDLCAELVDGADWPWTFHRALDHALDADKAWRAVRRLPRCDTLLTAGSARGVEHGLDDLVRRCREDADLTAMVMAGGGLAPEHVPWLLKAGVRQFHVGGAARPRRDWKDRVDATLVKGWRRLIDSELRHENARRGTGD